MNNGDDNQASLSRLIQVIQKASNGAIVLPSNPTPDSVASSCALYLALVKMGKSVTLSCSTPVNIPVTASDKIQSQLTTTGDNLVISFPYTDGSIDKVDYNIQGNNFNLIVAPRPGFPKLDPKQVKYNYTGGNLDFIIVVDAPTLSTLGALYRDNEKQFQGKEIVNIDRHLTNSYYGTVNFVNKSASSISEIVYKVIQALGVEIDRDIATNIYAGINASTNNFTSYSVTADTFDTVAKLLRAGAMKKNISKLPQSRMPAAPFGQPFNSPFPPASSPFNSNFSSDQDIKPLEGVEKEPIPQDSATPQDWLKPKIFRGGGGSGLI